ncbi:MAG: chromosomal replication initiator protein DnaA [bacterium]|nr:chromosomal replication initiator protein DnaA [bacterium]
MDTKDIWDKALVYIKAAVNSSIAYRVYIQQIKPVSCTDSIFVVSVALAISKNMINLRYRGFIESALEQVTGNKYTLKLLLDSEVDEFLSPSEDSYVTEEGTLNPKYTFDSFVVGESNRYAAAFARSAAEKPGIAHNPFFLYGNSGLGKTHLMHAIGNEIKKLNPEYKIIYVTSEQFMNEFVDSIVSKTSMEFKRKYRGVDVLLIDDVQFLENKEGLQEEVFHTFNDLYGRNKQIVLTSDRMPNELVKLEERLRTRFGQGLTFDISIPNFETRVAILKKKADEHNVKIPDVVLHLIADRIKTNIRELEGALNKVISVSEISQHEITLDAAREVIDSLVPNGGVVQITPNKIIDRVAVYYNVPAEEITGLKREKKFIVPRQVAMYLCSELANMNYAMIGEAFAKDRTSAMHNVKKIEKRLSEDDALNKAVSYITKDLKSQ